MKRFLLIDLIRGFAVFLMIIFHFSYDLKAFGFVSIDFQEDLFWFVFPRIIVFLFLISMGLSLYVVHFPQFKKHSFALRLGKLVLAALGISLVTYFLFPNNWIYFGTLHCIALSSLVSLPLIRFPRIAGVLGLLMLSFDFLGFRIPFWQQSHNSMDYIPLFPWVAIVWLGLAAARENVHLVALPEKWIRPFLFLGRHSFIIYLVHQPILFGSVYLFHQLL